MWPAEERGKERMVDTSTPATMPRMPMSADQIHGTERSMNARTSSSTPTKSRKIREDGDRHHSRGWISEQQEADQDRRDPFEEKDPPIRCWYRSCHSHAHPPFAMFETAHGRPGIILPFPEDRAMFALSLCTVSVASGSSGRSPRTVIRSGDSSLRRPSAPIASI